MFTNSWLQRLQTLTRHSLSSRDNRRQSKHRRVALAVERLEVRDVPSGFALGFGGDGADGGKHIGTDTSGNIYVAGTFEQTVDFDPGPATRSLSSAGAEDYFVSKFDSSGAFQWARRIGSSGTDTVFNGNSFGYLAVRPDGSVCFSTTFSGTSTITGVNQDGSPYSAGSVAAVGSHDALLGVFDPSGGVQWTRTMGGVGTYMEPRVPAAMPDGSILIGGDFAGTVDCDRTASYGDNHDILTSAGDLDIYLAKLNGDGSLAWAERGGGTAKDSATVVADAVGNVYLEGACTSATVVLGSQSYTIRGYCDAFISKVDAATGSFLWVQQVGGVGDGTNYQFPAAYHDPSVTDPNLGNVVYCCGQLAGGTGPVTFGSTSITLTRFQNNDDFIAKLDGNGNFAWAKEIQGWNDDWIGVTSMDAAGSLYTAGTILGPGATDFDPDSARQALVAQPSGTSQVGFVVKIDPDGNFQWVRQIGKNVRPFAGADGAVYLAGSYDATDSLTNVIDIGTGSMTLSSQSSASSNTFDAFFAKLDQSALGGIYGRVLYPNGYSAAGTTVTLTGPAGAQTTLTGDFGELAFRYLPAGDYTMTAPGASRAFTLSAGQFLSDQNLAPNYPGSESTKYYVVNDASSGDRTYDYGPSSKALANNTLNSGDTAPRGAASVAGGTKVWVIDSNKTVYVYNPTGGLLGSWSATGMPNNFQTEGIATNGTDIWILGNSASSSDKVFKYAGAASRTSGSQKAASSFALSIGDSTPKDIVTDGASLWTVDANRTVYKYTLTGSLLGSWGIDPANTNPTGITLNPADVRHLWIVDNVALKVFEYTDATGLTSGTKRASATFALASGNTNPQGIADPPTEISQVSASSRSVLAAPASSALPLTATALQSVWASSPNRFWGDQGTDLEPSPMRPTISCDLGTPSLAVLESGTSKQPARNLGFDMDEVFANDLGWLLEGS